MWICFGILAIVCTFLNIVIYVCGKDNRLFMGLGIGFTALCLCSEYSLVVFWTQNEDWGAIMDVVPTMGTWIWIITVSSILINLIPVFVEFVKKR